MNLRVHPLHTDIEPPSQLNNPFCYEPHPLCLLAAEEVKKYVRAHEELLADAERGEMFGVLIVTSHHLPRGGEQDPVQDTPRRRGVCFLAAYAGLLAGRNDWDWFVPPIYDAQQPDGHFKQEEAKISALNKEIEALEASLNPPEGGKVPSNLSSESESSPLRGDRGGLLTLKHQRKQMSNELLHWLFQQYNLINYKEEVRNVVDIWRDYHNSPKLLRKFPLPPGGTGECCAPKLFQYAYQHGLEPLAVAEFWWGESPKREIRHHFQFYPACNGKCKPILSWQIPPLWLPRGGGITPLSSLLFPLSSFLTPPRGSRKGVNGEGIYVQTLFTDDQIAVVVKPEGLLSVPGNTGEVSLYDIMRRRFPNATGPMMVHRLDQATSGIIVVAKTEFAFKELQRQFERREVKKRYVAMIEELRVRSEELGVRSEERGERREERGEKKEERGEWVYSSPSGEPEGGSIPPPRGSQRGVISLPLAPDYLDRPRQVVDYEEGKPAVTDYEIIGREGPYYRVLLTPHTGRTHQLRVHCAHRDGLGMPIVGDDLYGFHSDRLYLHAEFLSFTHPLTGEKMEFRKAPDF